MSRDIYALDDEREPQWTARYLITPDCAKDLKLDEHSYEFLHPRITHILRSINIKNLFPIQKAVIPFLIHPYEDGLSPYASDVCVSAETGQGKTFCYVLPIVHNLIGRVIKSIRCVTLIPTRELARQVWSCFQLFAHPVQPAIEGDSKTILKVGCLIGQAPFSEERELLKSSPDIIVCTPGRLVEHYHYQDIINLEGITFSNLQWIVIDEADVLLSQSFQDWYGLFEQKDMFHNEWFTRPAIHNKDTQKILLSATMTKDPQKLAKLGLNRPIFFITKSTGIYATPETLSHFYTFTNDSDKPFKLMRILNEQFQSQVLPKLLIFCQSKETAHRLARLLQLHFLLLHNTENALERPLINPIINELSAKYSQNYRTHLIEQFRLGKINVMVCSDVAARGLDIADVDMVINYDVPYRLKTYIHRSGRTARAGRLGKSLTLLKSNQIRYFKSNLIKGGIAKAMLKQWILQEDQVATSSLWFTKLLKLLEICLNREHLGHLLNHEPLNHSNLQSIEASFKEDY